MSFSERIKERRRMLHMTQLELASKVGVSLKTIGRWESGKRFPRLRDFSALSAALGTTIEYLAEDKNDPTIDDISEVDWTFHQYLHADDPPTHEELEAFEAREKEHPSLPEHTEILKMEKIKNSRFPLEYRIVIRYETSTENIELEFPLGTSRKTMEQAIAAAKANKT